MKRKPLPIIVVIVFLNTQQFFSFIINMSLHYNVLPTFIFPTQSCLLVCFQLFFIKAWICLGIYQYNTKCKTIWEKIDSFVCCAALTATFALSVYNIRACLLLAVSLNDPLLKSIYSHIDNHLYPSVWYPSVWLLGTNKVKLFLPYLVWLTLSCFNLKYLYTPLYVSPISNYILFIIYPHSSMTYLYISTYLMDECGYIHKNTHVA